MLPTPHTMYLYGQIHTRQLRSELLRRQLAAQCGDPLPVRLGYHVARLHQCLTEWVRRVRIHDRATLSSARGETAPHTAA